MKMIFGLLLLMAIGWGVVYYVGGSASFDPTQQGRDARAAITTGMTWSQVLDVAGAPGKWSKLVRKQHKNFQGEIVETIDPSPSVDYRKGSISRHLRDGNLPDGFMVTYTFSRSVAFFVEFVGSGKVAEVRDAPTEADLLQMGD